MRQGSNLAWIARRDVFLMLAGTVILSRTSDLCAQPLTAGSVPKTVYVIRHGEKPQDQGDRNLILQGWARAAMLAREAGQIFPDLAYVFATAPAHGSPSCREIETVEPLAEATKIPCNFEFSEGREKALADEIFAGPIYKDRVILICWHHSRIPALLQALGVTSHVAKPDEGEFGSIWRLTYGGGNAPEMTEYSQPELTAVDQTAADGVRRRAIDSLRKTWPRCFR